MLCINGIVVNSDGRRFDFQPWNELIPDTLGLIFNNLEPLEILQVIPLVCKSWCKVVQGPYCWQKIDADDFFYYMFHEDEEKVEKALRALIPRSSGCLRELCVFCINDHMLSFISEHAGPLLQTLEIHDSTISSSEFELFLKMSTSLTTLVIRNCCKINIPSLEAITRNCKRLVSLTWGNNPQVLFEKPSHYEVGSIMPNLKRLSLEYAMVDDEFVLWLLSCCPELERVDVYGDLMLDPRVVKEKYPNIVTFDVIDEPAWHIDYNEYCESDLLSTVSSLD